MTSQHYGRWIIALGLVLTGNLRAQKVANWRLYTEADGLKVSFTTAVSVGPKGAVWAKHAVDAFSVLDGYSVTTIPAPGAGNDRVYQSRSDQIWSTYSEGLQEFKSGQWVQYPIPEMRGENRMVPLLPAERDHVLFLLSNRLMEYDASVNQTILIRHVNQTKLGRFLDMTAVRTGGVWITGKDGIAKVPGPVRKMSSNSEWREYVNNVSVQNLQRPFEDDQGGVTTVAESSLTSKKVLVHFDGATWKTLAIPVSPGENIRQCWRDGDQSFWALTISSLIHWAEGEKEVMKKEGALAGNYYDVATETNGVFWVATSEGLVRHAPFTWQTPEEVTGANTLVYAIGEDHDGGLWFAGADAVYVLQNGRWKSYPLPEETDPALHTARSPFSFAGGSAVLSLNNRLYRFNGKSEQFERITHPSDRGVKVIGQLKEGRVCVQTYDFGAREGGGRLEIYDGKNFTPFLDWPAQWSPGSEMSFIYQSQNGDLWLGSTSGLALHHDNKWLIGGTAEGNFLDEALSLLETDDGKIWCGGRNKVSEFDGKKWSTLRSGFDRVSAMIKHRGSIWVATRGGLYRYTRGSWVLNATDEGLPSSAIYEVYVDSHGRIWAGTSQGISSYHPEADTDPPKTFVVKTKNEIKTPSDGVITLAFGGRDKWKYTRPDRLLYSFRLDDGQWMPYTAATYAAFTNLSGGKHRFAVRAADRNLNEDPSPGLFEFTVIVPWFKDPRLVGISLLGLVVVFFFAGLAFNRHRQLVRSYAEVELKVAERSRELELANQELLHSQKMKALGTLAAGIAHDFNSILSIIKGSAQIIESNLDDQEKIRTRTERIKTVVNQGAGLVKAMLGFSRAGEWRVAESNVNRIVEEAVKLLGDRFGPAIQIQFEPAPSLPRIYGSSEVIQQMLINLMLNASDAMEERGKIILRTGHLSRLPSQFVLPPGKAEGHVYISVQDFGCGISPEILPRIFEPFFTTKALSTRRGTGLGLSMVYEFAKEMGYGLQVESTPGEGSTFSIVIPLLQPDTAARRLNSSTIEG